MTISIYPGSFDPITNGHIDIATRAAKLFEKVIIAVYGTPNKHLVFNAEERVDLARRALANLSNVEVVSFSGLTVDFAKQDGKDGQRQVSHAGSVTEKADQQQQRRVDCPCNGNIHLC